MEKEVVVIIKVSGSAFIPPTPIGRQDGERATSDVSRSQVCELVNILNLNNHALNSTGLSSFGVLTVRNFDLADRNLKPEKFIYIQLIRAPGRWASSPSVQWINRH
ncbi:hypothetical protein TNCV_3503071 [Trichonephila clavipes]|uniref:Uncharacterized protein n=1 Tax=Trichonephila clavipes TaxID=2585209 RepID=A0A8X6RXD9_TRICX|nr:hypothetical protein TNCV_3503071 [Trichonephila clavipes]